MFKDRLSALRKKGLFRRIRDRATAQGREIKINGRRAVNFASNDYLGLSSHPALRAAAAQAAARFGAGSGASRLLSGGCPLHRELEKKTASFKGTGAALIFNSGYAANTGALPALAGEESVILSDELNHASIVEGCRLSRAETLIYRHRDVSHLGALMAGAGGKRIIVATDSVFSMDGDIAPLDEISGLCRRHGALLYIDEAHATGVLGPGGRGGLAHFGIKPRPWIIQMGTYSKAIGSFGAFVAGGRDTVEWLVNIARTLIFSTALPPASVAPSIAALRLIEEDPSPIERLWRNTGVLKDGLERMGIDAGASETPIMPIMLSSSEDAVSVSEGLLGEGIYVPAIRPPAVPAPRLRLTVTAAHKEEDIEMLLAALGRSLGKRRNRRLRGT